LNSCGAEARLGFEGAEDSVTSRENTREIGGGRAEGAGQRGRARRFGPKKGNQIWGPGVRGVSYAVSG